jgi:hypothetical protein
MAEKESKSYFDLSNVEKQKNFLTAEEFPDGPFGSPIRKDEPVQNKASRKRRLREISQRMDLHEANQRVKAPKMASRREISTR